MDLIDRQQAIDTLCSKCTVDKPETCSTIQKGDNWCEEVYTLQKVPSAQPKPQEGKWIPVHPIQSDDPGAYMCSKCKTGMWEIRPSAYHYCPNCGAKMKGVQHETD